TRRAPPTTAAKSPGLRWLRSADRVTRQDRSVNLRAAIQRLTERALGDRRHAPRGDLADTPPAREAGGAFHVTDFPMGAGAPAADAMTSEEYTTFRGDRRPMFNRLDFSSWGEDPPEENFFVIRGECGLFYVARDTAVAVAETLEQDEPPRWIRFTDLQGSEVRVRSAL